MAQSTNRIVRLGVTVSKHRRLASIALFASLAAILLFANGLLPCRVSVTNVYPGLQVTKVQIRKGANQTYYYPNRLWFYVSRIQALLARWFTAIQPRFAAKSHFRLDDAQGAVCWLTIKQPNGPGTLSLTFIDSNDVYWGAHRAERRGDLVMFPGEFTNNEVFTKTGLLFIPSAAIHDTKAKTTVWSFWLLPTVTNYTKGHLRVTGTDMKANYGKSLVRICNEL